MAVYRLRLPGFKDLLSTHRGTNTNMIGCMSQIDSLKSKPHSGFKRLV